MRTLQRPLRPRGMLLGINAGKRPHDPTVGQGANVPAAAKRNATMVVGNGLSPRQSQMKEKADPVGGRMAESEADRCRKKAEECRRLAEKVVSALDRDTWLRVADEWLKLAQTIDGKSGPEAKRGGPNLHPVSKQRNITVPAP